MQLRPDSDAGFTAPLSGSVWRGALQRLARDGAVDVVGPGVRSGTDCLHKTAADEMEGGVVVDGVARRKAGPTRSSGGTCGLRLLSSFVVRAG